MSAKRRKETHPLIARLNALAARRKMTNEQIAQDWGGASASAIQKWRKFGRSPKNQAVHGSLESYLAGAR